MRHWKLYAYVIPFRTATAFLVLLVNCIHPLIHGTPLDGGMLDGLIQQLDMFALGVAQCDSGSCVHDVEALTPTHHNHNGGS